MSSNLNEQIEEIQRKLEKLALSDARYHIFLCCDQSKPKCCSYEQGLESWEYLKKRLSELNLNHVLRTKADCLRICTGGPIAVIYPDGIWYRACTPMVLEQIIQEHFIKGKPVEEFIIYRSKYAKE